MRGKSILSGLCILAILVAMFSALSLPVSSVTEPNVFLCDFKYAHPYVYLDINISGVVVPNGDIFSWQVRVAWERTDVFGFSAAEEGEFLKASGRGTLFYVNPTPLGYVDIGASIEDEGPGVTCVKGKLASLKLFVILKTPGKTLLVGEDGNFTITSCDLYNSYGSAVPHTIGLPITFQGFATIQAGVDAAIPGEIVHVFPGTYPENVLVDKDHLTVQGELGSWPTIVDAGGLGHAFTVTEDYDTIKDFKIINADNGLFGYQGLYAGVWFYNDTGGLEGGVVDNCYFEECNFGIGVGDQPWIWGTYWQDFDDFTITNCVMRNITRIGIFGGWQNSNGWLIENNDIWGNPIPNGGFVTTALTLHPDWDGAGPGVASWFNHKQYGYEQGIEIDGGKDDVIQYNLVHDFAVNGIYLVRAEEAYVKKNELANFTGQKVSYAASGQPFFPSDGYGIQIVGRNDKYEHHKILENYIHDCDVSGIEFWSLAYPGWIDDVQVFGNTITENYVGIRLDRWCIGTIIHCNDIYNNTLYGLQEVNVHSSALPIIAELNWWGNETGPYCLAQNPSGTGDEVQETAAFNVDFTPWREASHGPWCTWVVAELIVDPPLIERESPETGECTCFEVKVKVTDIKNMYGYEFKLTWNPALIKLKEVHVTQIFVAPFLAKNDTSVPGQYWLAVTETADTQGVNGSFVLVTLVFHVEYASCIPCTELETRLKFVGVRFSDPTGQPENEICVLIQDGRYSIHTSTPKLEMRSGGKTKIVFEGEDAKECKEFTVEVWLLNATKIYDYWFVIYWDSTQFNLTDYEINRDFLQGPFEWVIIEEWHDTWDWLYVCVEAKCWTESANGDGILMTLTFHIKDLSEHGLVWKKDKEIHKEDSIFFGCWELSGKCPDPVPIQQELIDINNLEIEIWPRPGDVNFDGKTNEKDLILIAKNFSQGAGIYDLNSDGKVDILDLVICAKRICIGAC